MQQAHHTLKHDLTKTVLLWSATFFALIGIIFLLSFHSLEGYMLDLMADHRLNYQTREFAKHLNEQDTRSIREESNALIQEQLISAILLIDASGELMHVSLSDQQQTQWHSKAPVNMASIRAQVAAQNHLHLYQRDIPGHQAILVLILDDRPVDIAIFSTTAWTAGLMLLLVMLSIKALHVSLKRQLIMPVEQLRKAVESEHLDDVSLHTLEEKLPDEAVDILEIFDHLKHTSDEAQSRLVEMMSALPSCFWWSYDGKTYAGISDKCTTILHQSRSELEKTPLWNWGGTSTQSSSNRHRLQKAILRGDHKLDFAYQFNNGNKECWFGEAITLCYDTAGKFHTAYGIINDISSRKSRQHEQTKQLELIHRLETTGTLAGGIAHEFNNALAGMNGNVFLIKQSAHDEQTLERVTRIEELIERSASMIDSMLSFAGKSFLHTVPINIVDFIKQFQSIALPALPDHIQFKLKIDANMLTDQSAYTIVKGDTKRLREALIHLLKNASFAVKNTHAPRISITLKSIDADEVFLRQHPKIASSHIVHLQIQDNGCGIPKQVLERIFDPFFTTREVGTGTGLGLSMTYGYVHQLGGTIDVESTVGRGTIFHIYFPGLTKAPEPKYPDTLLHGNGEMVLVVDDDQIFRESTCDVLTRMGYHTISAWDGKEAIKQFEQHQHEVKLIFMDILMPGLNGILTSRRIRKIAPTIPIIFLTAYDRTQPLEPEVYEYHAELINKPFRISTLSQAIQKVLRG